MLSEARGGGGMGEGRERGAAHQPRRQLLLRANGSSDALRHEPLPAAAPPPLHHHRRHERKPQLLLALRSAEGAPRGKCRESA